MLNYLKTNREGQFLVIGILLTVLGFSLSIMDLTSSRWAFYGAIVFLGFYAAKEALVETFKHKAPNDALLMILSALGATLIQYESEGAVLLLIFAGAEVLEDYVTDKATDSISELMSSVPNQAHIMRENGKVDRVPTDSLAIGDTVIVQKGAQLPIDGTIDRQAVLNESALTGESIPVEKSSGDMVYAGTLNEGDVFYLTVTQTSNDTIFSNIIHMVKQAQQQPSKKARWIDTFESYYVTGVLIAVPLFIIGLFFLQDLSWQDAFYRGLVLLTVASPCALVASITPATLSAISNGAKNGILFKGGKVMERFGELKTLYTDKTGTLTQGEFNVTDYELADDYLPTLVYMEQQSNHPIAQAIVAHFKSEKIELPTESAQIEEIAGAGLKMGNITVGKPDLFKQSTGIETVQAAIDSTDTTVIIAEHDRIVGYVNLADKIRDSSQEAVQQFQAAGVEVVLLTGDQQRVAEAVATDIGIPKTYAELLPEDKMNFIQSSQSSNEVVGMIGDGINDAPALAHADIGIAMGSGSQAAMESADIVIVKNDLQKLFNSYRLSQRLDKIIKQNLFFAIGVIITLITLNILGWLDLPMGVVFHEVSTILVILNGLRLLRNSSTAATEANTSQQHTADESETVTQ
ncbi:heavy metal translocating P-type ATPase [Dolosigranulum pigrum]|uniref:heavy metal translocating P-type ATPase n=1 Tax=Dolosigranulum pigrum TaxID=29394 RepID=UPI001AD87E04|nr:heavy metal translocating P-type ATPase [Dolosigranulum pigrum]QTJ34250.1 heavy metal translocating P-type ATPase [Dolosigranulum pigrum]QTJ39426.1 heavy metal translocating P-type ATPase [Dolosigranulum pigrum]QTJ47917.1 heavy metal translocating P-type ATPase [Dolosigranulum pigrum]